MEKYLTIEETAQKLGKSVDDVRAMMNAGQLHGMMADGVFKFKESDVEALSGESKEDTLMTIEGDVLFAEGEADQPADAAAETWIAADMENVFESEDFNIESATPETAMTADELQPAPLMLSPESDDTSLGAVLVEDEAGQGAPGEDLLGDEPVISIDPESGIATITSPTPGISRTRMIIVSEPEPRHKAFTPLLAISLIVGLFALFAVGSAFMGLLPSQVEWAEENLPYLAGGAGFVALIAGIVGYVLDRQKAAGEAAAARLGRR
ncbi:MAG: hypothetical protein GWP05_04810 [Anaerolineaceae bacterium]|nr:hypothetical protein [Anaerolineaceae bacterium]